MAVLWRPVVASEGIESVALSGCSVGKECLGSYSGVESPSVLLSSASSPLAVLGAGSLPVVLSSESALAPDGGVEVTPVVLLRERSDSAGSVGVPAVLLRALTPLAVLMTETSCCSMSALTPLAVLRRPWCC